MIEKDYYTYIQLDYLRKTIHILDPQCFKFVLDLVIVFST